MSNLAGAGDVSIANTKTLTVNSSSDTSLTGVISGDGALIKTGASNLTLSGTNTYTGDTTIQAGTVTAASNAAFGIGTVNMSDGSTMSFSGNISLNEFFTIAGTVTFNVPDGSIGELTNTMPGSGAILRKTGAGELQSNTTNKTYSGGTLLEEGSLEWANDGSFGSGAVTMSDGTTINLINGLDIDNDITINGTSSFAISIGLATVSGVIDGTGTFTKTGTATVTLTGTNTYSGGTTLSGGTIVANNNAALGTGSLSMNNSTTLDIGSAIALSNAVVLSDSSTINNDASSTLSGIISGSGSFSKTGAGVLTLSGTNTYSGGTTLSAGTISISDDAGLGSGSIAMSDGTTLVFGSGISASNNATIAGTSTLNVASGTGTLSGIISSTGALTKTGAGTLALSGTNTYTGATTVSEGTLSVVGSIESSSGIAVASGAILNFAPAAASSVESKVISGDGSVTKTGANSQTLSGTNTYTGTTTVSAGTLVVTGTIASGAGDVTVASGATLKGTGSLPATVIQDGGKLDPGTSIGTITVDSLEIESDGTLEIEISPSATSLVNVTNTATINSGATLEILPQAGVYIEGTEHIFLSANSIVGTFAEEDITFDLTELEGEIAVTSIEIVGNDYIIFLQGALQSATSANTAPLQGDAASVYLTSDLVTRINRTQMGLISEVQDQRFLQRQLCCNSVCDNEKDQNEEETAEEFETDTCQDSGDISTYLIVDYSRANIRKRQYMIAGKSYLKSALGGCDIYLTEEFVMGGCFGYVNGDTSSQESGLSHVRSNSFNIGTYFQGRAKGNFFVDGALNIGKNYFESKRSINQFEKGTYHGFDMASQLRILYQSYCAKVNYRPYISTTYYLQKTGNYTEREQTPNQLKVGKDRFDFFELEGGIAFWAPFKIRSWEVVPQLSFSYTRTYLKKPHDVNATFVSSYNGNETQRIANVTDKQWKIDGGISAHSGSCTEFFINYEAVFDNGYSNYQQYRAGVQTSF